MVQREAEAVHCSVLRSRGRARLLKNVMGKRKNKKKSKKKAAEKLKAKKTKKANKSKLSKKSRIGGKTGGKKKKEMIPTAKQMERKERDKAVAETMREIKEKGPIRGYLISDSVVIEKDFELFLPFYDRSSFGEIHGVKNKRIELALPEALYLMEREKLIVYGNRKLNLKQFIKKASKLEENFWTRYRVYRELRTRGYTLKTALKFGADFRVYRRGVKPGEDHAKWVLFCANENSGLTWRKFSAMNRVAHSTRKNLLVGIVDDEGDVTYYTIRWIKP